MNKEEFRDLLIRVWDKVEDDNDTDQVGEGLKEVQAAFDEQYDLAAGGEDWKRQFEDMKRKYKERFFNTPDGAIEDQKEDIKKDVNPEITTKTIDELFESSESDYKEKK